MKFNRKKFFDGFREKIDSSIEPEQVDGLEFLLGEMESDPFWKDVRHIAYALATAGHETAWSFQPVEEGYYLGNSTRVKKFQKTLRYFPYYGRGYVQLTWKKNYEKAGKILGLDLAGKPELALEKHGAYKTLTYGMHQGWFTGKKLTDYISGSKCDYKNARRIINGTDKAALIAGYAVQFEKILKNSAAGSIPANQSDSSVTEEANSNNAENPTTQPPSIETSSTTTEIKETTETDKPAGKETLEVTTKNEQDVNIPAQVDGAKPYNDIGLRDTLIGDAKSLVPANTGINVMDAISQATGLPPAIIKIITVLAVIAGILTALWVLYRIGAWLMHNWREQKRVELQAMINTDTKRKNIEIVPHGEAPKPEVIG